MALQPSSIGSKFRMMRIGCSLRTHRRIAVDAVTGFLPLDQSDRGYHCSHGIGEKCMMTKPIRHYKTLTTIQGKVTANQFEI